MCTFLKIYAHVLMCDDATSFPGLSLPIYNGKALETRLWPGMSFLPVYPSSNGAIVSLF